LESEPSSKAKRLPEDHPSSFPGLQTTTAEEEEERPSGFILRLWRAWHSAVLTASKTEPRTESHKIQLPCCELTGKGNLLGIQFLYLGKSRGEDASNPWREVTD
jgi:hypothetical protein